MKSRETKICLVCNEEYLATTEYFYKDKKGKDGLRSNCKLCQRQYAIQYSQTHKAQRQIRRNKYHKTLRGYLNKLWHKIRDRCNNPRYKQYKDYGERGIKVKFNSFENFFYYVVNVLRADPRGLTIDRIDNDGDYEPGNIRFVSKAENNRNKSNIAQMEKQSKKKTA